ncbi:hypothetical protein [Nocardioides yefusunii]|uniref:NodB homology domain-containing protein n=1 Tax=Nocardioides yefusunii TaxID=2500546 RepID=A0ABW1QZ80_9ACTN|nr:hypothetical protein [Nocardioides yefusunii]
MSNRIVITAPGPQGSPGPQGEPGPSTVPTALAVAHALGDGQPGRTVIDEHVAAAASDAGTPIGRALYAAIGDQVTPLETLTFAGQQAVSEAALVVRSGDDERATLTPDGRTAVYMVTGESSQTFTVSGCAVSDDTLRKKTGTQSRRFTTSGAATAVATHSPATALTHGPASIWRTWVWIEDVTALTGYFQIIHTRGAVIDTVAPPADQRWVKQVPVSSLRTGWNLISDDTLGMYSAAGWGSIYSTRYIFQTTKATSVSVDSTWFECPKKASLLLIQDGGYKSYMTHAIPELRSRKYPTVWALNPGWLGKRPGAFNETITVADVATLKAAGDEISFHSWVAGNDGQLMATMTREQVRDDSLKSIAVAQAEGWGKGYLFRGAFLQNLAPNARGCAPYHAMLATSTERDSQIATWPPMNRLDVARVGLHFSTDAFIDDIFNRLEKTRGLCLGYTHGISTVSAGDMTPARLTYLLGKIDAAVAAGWLEVTTFERLLASAGGVLRA